MAKGIAGADEEKYEYASDTNGGFGRKTIAVRRIRL
jgi:hypothetical protein